MRKLVLIDANALVHRAFHALPPLTSPQGQVVNAVYGFTSVLLKTIKELKPDFIAAAFDLAGPTFRHEEYQEYKAHREKAPDELYAQIPPIKEVLEAFGVEVFEKEGFEADDLIGSLSERAKRLKDVQTIILTGDLDTLQLVEGDKVVVFTLRKGVTDTVLYNEAMVKERYGLEPYQVVDFKGLKGDPSDNIPGVPGIGEKTAAVLLQKYGTIENLYKEIKKIKEFKNGEVVTAKLGEKLLANEKQAIFSKRLATIVTDLDLDFSLDKVSWQKKFDYVKTEQLFRKFGFNSLLSRLPKSDASEEKSAMQQQESLIFQKEQPFILKTSNQNVVYLNSVALPEKISPETKEVLENESMAKRGHNLKPVIKALLSEGVHIKNFDFDTAVAAYLIRPDLKNYDFDKIFFLEFGRSPADEPTALFKLAEALWGRLKEKNLIKVFEEIEMPLIPVLAEMEKNGIKIDLAGLSRLSKKVSEGVSRLEKKIYGLAGQEFNINSPQQLGEILFDKLFLGAKVRKTNEGARSTAVSELEKIIDDHPIVSPVIQYRELQKLKTTYIEPFPQFVTRDGRVHTTYNQTGTATGRLSSEEPNLQNIPIRTELGQEFRKSFVSEAGYDLVSLDYSQIELRVAAYLSGDKKMLEAFQNNEDIHTRTSAEVFDVEPQKVTPEMRREAKALNFGVLFGMGPLGFARSAGIDKMKAREFITKYLKKFSGMAEYMEKTKEEARKNGFVQTYFGRRRELPEIHSTMPQVTSQAERMAINAPIQGTEADIMKLAMIRVHNFIHEKGLEEKAKILLQVHDELLCEIKEEKSRELALEFKKIMEEVWQVGVPIVVDVKVGKNWASQSRI